MCRTALLSVTHLSDSSIDLLVQEGTLRKWKKGAFLLKEGEKCQEIHFIESGIIKAFQVKDGKDINLDFYFEHTFATNLKSLRSAESSAYSLQAMEELTTCSFNKPGLFKLYAISQEIELWGKSLLESLLVEQEGHSAFFKLYSPEERYAYILEYKPMIIQRVPLSQLASYLGITRESLSRIRRRIK